jgi:hypothetical protein
MNLRIFIKYGEFIDQLSDYQAFQNDSETAEDIVLYSLSHTHTHSPIHRHNLQQKRLNESSHGANAITGPVLVRVSSFIEVHKRTLKLTRGNLMR